MQFEWKPVLEQWSQDLIESLSEAETLELPPEIRASGWLGCPGASEEEIQSLEDRLGVSLPLSYRSFLAVTNGWQPYSTWWGIRLWSTREVNWFDMGWAWDDLESLSISDAHYFVYGPDQDPISFRQEYLKTALAISDLFWEGAQLLLNPKISSSEGEWEAWYLDSKLPGAYRYRSFWELMTSSNWKTIGI